MARHLADVRESAGKIHLSFCLERDPDPPPHGHGGHFGVKITERSFPEAASSNIMPSGQIWRYRDLEHGLFGPMRMTDKDGKSGNGTSTGVIVKSKPKTKKPAMYKVLMLNDDYTPMEFVVHVLERIFAKNRQDATRIMLHVHRRGVGLCGVYTYEVAETKVTQVVDYARRHQHPLQCTLEKD
jgi:ATP-dependent Clp protease adaptor protein ClpS